MRAAPLSILLISSVAAAADGLQDPLRLFLQEVGGIKASETCVGRIVPVLRQKLGRGSTIRLLDSREAAEVVAVVDECATYTFSDGSFTAKGGPTPKAGPAGTPYIDKEYGVKTETRTEYVVTVGLTYADQLFGVSNDGDEKSLRAAGEAVAKKVLQWAKANRARIRAGGK
jgi:hypothetical protein